MLWPSRLIPQNTVLFAPPDGSGGGSWHSNHALKKARQGQAEGRGEAALGNTGKSVDQYCSSSGGAGGESPSKTRAARARRATAFALQRTAAALIPKESVSTCRWAVQSKAAGVDVHLREYEDGAVRASFGKLQNCGSVWHCPVCSRRISENRRAELNKLLVWARRNGLRPIMVTYTARHHLGDDIKEQLSALKKAKQTLRQRREWRSMKSQIKGTVTATEVTYGENGWHTHFHEIMLIEEGSEDEALCAVSILGDAWRACLHGVGMSGGEAAFHAQGAGAAGSYVAKWGAAEEMTLTGAKTSAGKGRTPMQLLSDAHAGDERAARIWTIYALAFKGRRQLVWSPGLKALAGIDEKDDKESSAESAEDERAAPILNIEYQKWAGRPGWLGARHRRARILDAAEIGGPSTATAVVLDGSSDTDFEPDDINLLE